MERVYIVYDEGKGDCYQENFKDLESANREAEGAWAYLTANERKGRHIYVGWIERSRKYVNEPEEDDWAYGWHSMESNDECFDSAKLVEE